MEEIEFQLIDYLYYFLFHSINCSKMVIFLKTDTLNLINNYQMNKYPPIILFKKLVKYMIKNI